MAGESQDAQNIQIFISYSHKDERLRAQLGNHLKGLELRGLAVTWHDGKLFAGDDFDAKIKTHLESADVCLLLVSSDFIASSYCYKVEMDRAMERSKAGQACVIPLILRPCDWQGLPFSGNLAVPKDGKAVTSWANRDAAFTDAARKIRQRVEDMLAARPSGTSEENPAVPPVSSLPERGIWNVPHNPNPNFIGREGLLEDLHEALASRHPAALTQAISGLGGVGKTQLAVQYAWQHGGEYKVVWWVRAEQPAQLAADYADLARALNLPEKDAREQEIVVEAVRKWLSINGEWLLIFDNAPDPEAVKPYLPAGRKGHVIITSRHHAWGGIAQRLDVKVLPIDDAVIFLRNRAGRPNDPDAKVLAKAMGFLPLALTQAAVYVERTGSSFARYIEILKRAEKELLASGVGAEDYDISVAAAIGLSLDKLQPASADLLILCAFLAPDDIPLDLIAAVGADLPKRLAATIADPKSFAECQGDLLSQSLIECPADGLLSVHRIVQAVVRSRLRPAQRKAWAKAAVAMMNEAFPDNIAKSPDVWPTCKRLFMHALAAASNAEGDDETLAAAAWLFNQAGEYLSLVSDLPGAKANFEKALAIDEKIFGPEHTKVAACLNNLGFVLQEQGNLPGANACFRRALAIDEKAYGLEHPDVATTVNNLGSVLVDEGDVAGAKACFQRALSIDEKTYGMDHPKLAIRTNNLGFVLDEEGNRTGAMACYQRALSIDQRTYGPNHPNVAVDLNNIGTVLVGEGNLAGAKTLFRQALGIDEEVYGREHPKVAERLNNLGWVLRLEGDLGGANACHRRALAIDEKAYGLDHPEVARDLHSLSWVLKDEGDFLEAKACILRALATLAKFFGDEHPKTRVVRENLAILEKKIRQIGARSGRKRRRK